MWEWISGGGPFSKIHATEKAEWAPPTMVTRRDLVLVLLKGGAPVGGGGGVGVLGTANGLTCPFPALIIRRSWVKPS